jgi:hypothetical protein
MSVVYVPPTAASVAGALTPYAHGGYYPHAGAYPYGAAGSMYGGQYASMYNPMSMGYGMGMGMGGVYDPMHYGYDDDYMYRRHARRYRRRGMFGRRRSLCDWFDDDDDYY